MTKLKYDIQFYTLVLLLLPFILYRRFKLKFDNKLKLELDSNSNFQ